MPVRGIESRQFSSSPGSRQRHGRSVRVSIVGVVLVALITSCSSAPEASTDSTTTVASVAPTAAESSDAAASPSSAPAEAVAIDIEKFKYDTPATVSPGATITVMNMDSEAHTVTADSGDAFDAKVDGSGETTFKAPTKPGEYKFHCTYHSNMQGDLMVK